MIDGVVVSPRRIIPDDRGKVIHILKATDPEFERFGDVDLSEALELGVGRLEDVGDLAPVIRDDPPGRNDDPVDHAVSCPLPLAPGGQRLAEYPWTVNERPFRLEA